MKYFYLLAAIIGSTSCDSEKEIVRKEHSAEFYIKEAEKVTNVLLQNQPEIQEQSAIRNLQKQEDFKTNGNDLRTLSFQYSPQGDLEQVLQKQGNRSLFQMKREKSLLEIDLPDNQKSVFSLENNLAVIGDVTKGNQTEKEVMIYKNNYLVARVSFVGEKAFLKESFRYSTAGNLIEYRNYKEGTHLEYQYTDLQNSIGQEFTSTSLLNQLPRANEFGRFSTNLIKSILIKNGQFDGQEFKFTYQFNEERKLIETGIVRDNQTIDILYTY